MISAREARDIILENVGVLESVTVSLPRSLGYALAEDIVADDNVPSFDNSSMDGFAVRSENVRTAPVVLEIVGEIPAGTTAEQPLESGQAMSIMTGAKIPQGSDAVVQVEWTERIDGKHVKVLRSVPAGHVIRRTGGDIEKGACALAKGQTIRPQEIGVLASLGNQFVQVYRPARVALLATGDELVAVNKRLPEGKIRNSNTYTLQALVHECGCEAIDLGIAKDSRDEIKSKIIEGLRADVLITSGGVSVGKFDLVIDILRELGVEVKFWKVNIKPGMPLVFGVHGLRSVFGLPGNPVSTMVTFLKFVKPALRKMMGHGIIDKELKLRATLQHEITKSDGKRHFARGILESQNGMMTVRSTGSQLSNVLSSLTKANCLIILPEEKDRFAQGEEVEVELV